MSKLIRLTKSIYVNEEPKYEGIYDKRFNGIIHSVVWGEEKVTDKPEETFIMGYILVNGYPVFEALINFEKGACEYKETVKNWMDKFKEQEVVI